MNRKYIFAIIIVMIIGAISIGQNAFAAAPPKSEYNSSTEYVTSTVSVLNNDGIVIQIVNDDILAQKARVIIYKNTGAGAVQVADSGDVQLSPTWEWSLGYTISESGEYWVRIQTSSESLIPKASFERFENSVWTPVVSYEPGDFAVFKYTSSGRIRLF